MRYAQHFSTRKTPQSQPIPGSKQVPNSAGGFSFEVDHWTKLQRFLILGNEGGSYYASEQKMTVENATSVLACLKEDPQRTIQTILEVSEQGRAPKNDPAIFALAICVGQKPTHPLALEAIPRVCRIGTHLFQFVEAVEAFRGHGRTLNRALQEWYTRKDPRDVAFQVVKYQQRNGWSHRDILRLSKPKVEGVLNTIFKWVVGKLKDHEEIMGLEELQPILAFEKAKNADKKEVARLIREFQMPREAVPTQHLNEPEVWEALLEHMPVTAMLRNLATMTRIELLRPMSQAVQKVTSELGNSERLKKSRVHPLQILSALLTYQAGKGEKGQNTWTPISQVTDALDKAFYASFKNVESTGKRWVLGLDVSGSMRGTQVAGMPHMSAVMAESAMSLITASTEPNHVILAFDTSIKPLSVSPRQRLDDVTKAVSSLVNGGTDCSLPILHALQHRIEADVFVIYTDSETWQGQIHPIQAIREYRNQMGIPAKLVTVAMCANKFSLGDQEDAGCLNVVGFDTNVPQVMADFVRN